MHECPTAYSAYGFSKLTGEVDGVAKQPDQPRALRVFPDGKGDPAARLKQLVSMHEGSIACSSGPTSCRLPNFGLLPPSSLSMNFLIIT